MKRVVVIFIIVAVWLSPLLASAVQVAPRITDREIVERLTRLEEGQKAINKRIKEKIALGRRGDKKGRMGCPQGINQKQGI